MKINKTLMGLIANSGGVIVTSITTFSMVPLFTTVIGIEEYAIFAIWLVSINLFQFLDFGLSVTLIQKKNRVIEKGFQFFKVYECVIILISTSILLFLPWFNLPNGDVYDKIRLDIPSYSLLLFLSPIIVQNIIKYYSHAILASHEYTTYNVLISINEIIKQFGGFLVYYMFNDWGAFLIYQITSSILVMFVSKKYAETCFSNETYVKEIKTSDVKYIINTSYKFSFVLFLSSIAGGVLSSTDRFILSTFTSMTETGIYAACFIVASIINMIIQPFHKISLPMFAKLVSNKNPDLIKNSFFNLSSILSTITIYISFCAIYFMDLYLWVIIDETQFNISQDIIVKLTLSFWLISCGWLSANLLQAKNVPSAQLLYISLATILGGGVSLILVNQGDISGASYIWIVHGLIQVTLLPIKLTKTLKFISLKEWYLKILLTPIIKIFSIYFILEYIMGATHIYIRVIIFSLLVIVDLVWTAKKTFLRK